MFKIIETISRNNKTNTEDTANTKFALTTLGYYDDTNTGLSPYGDDQFFDSIQKFQNDHDLKVDGVLKPNGPTEGKIKEKLEKDEKTGNVFKIFKNNFKQMKEANTIDADKYFHCKANYEATDSGWFGSAIAAGLSAIREISQAPKQIIKDGFISTTADTAKDHKANRHGRSTAKSNKFPSAKEACAIFRPTGLDDKY